MPIRKTPIGTKPGAGGRLSTPTNRLIMTAGGASRARPTRSNAGGAARGQARAAQVKALNVAKRPRVNLPSGRPAKGRTAAAGARGRQMTRDRVIAARRNTAAIGSRRSGAPSQAGSQLKYGQVRSGGQGIGAALESYGDIGDFLKNLGN